MISIAICDDHRDFAHLFHRKLKSLCDHNACVLPAFYSGLDIIEYLKINVIDILFLDIDMPDTNGFELAKFLCDKYPDIIIIFVSAYEDFVYSSFEYCPFRFLRKGYLDDELEITLCKAIEKILLSNNNILFDTTDGQVSLKPKDILFFEGQKNYYYIYTVGGQAFKCRGTMESVNTLMEKYYFFRIHSAYIVNLEHIENINNKCFLIMKNNKTLSISKKRMPDFKNVYMQFIRRRVGK